jgi:hypothetical protein
MMAGSGASAQVIFFKFKKKETVTDTKCMEIPIVYEVSNLSQGVGGGNNVGSPSGPHHFEFPPRPMLHVASQASAYTDPGEGFNFDKVPILLMIHFDRKVLGQILYFIVVLWTQLIQ